MSGAADPSSDCSVSEAGALTHACIGHTNLSWKGSPYHHSSALCLVRIVGTVSLPCVLWVCLAQVQTRMVESGTCSTARHVVQEITWWP